MITEERILGALRKVYDPEIPVNLVDLGLIYSIDIDDQLIKIKMTLTATACPMKAKIAEDVRVAVEGVDGAGKTRVEIVWEPRWNPEMISPAGRIALGME